MATLKEQLKEYDLKPVGDRVYSEFMISLMKGNEGCMSTYTINVKTARKELKIPMNWNLINLGFN